MGLLEGSVVCTPELSLATAPIELGPITAVSREIRLVGSEVHATDLETEFGLEGMGLDTTVLETATLILGLLVFRFLGILGFNLVIFFGPSMAGCCRGPRERREMPGFGTETA